MKFILIFISVSFVSICHAAFKTDALNVTGSSVTINGISYSWPSAGGTSGQCLQTDGGTPQVLTWADCGSGTTPASANFALLENTGFILLEDGSSRLQLEK